MKRPSPENDGRSELEALRAQLAPAVRDVIDARGGARAPDAAELQEVIARARTRPVRARLVLVPAACAMASLAAFVLVQSATPLASAPRGRDVVRISYAERDATGSAFTIDLVIQEP